MGDEAGDFGGGDDVIFAGNNALGAEEVMDDFQAFIQLALQRGKDFRALTSGDGNVGVL